MSDRTNPVKHEQTETIISALWEQNEEITRIAVALEKIQDLFEIYCNQKLS